MIATKTIPLMVPYIPEGAIEAVSDVLRTRWLGEGPRVKEFEQRFSEQIAGGRSCQAVGSGTDALHLAYLLAGIGPGDEVIAPLFTCSATNIPLLYCGAKIRFCDVAQNSLNMDPVHCRSLVSERTKAIVVVHYGGLPVSDEFFKMGTVIEDCAQFILNDMPIRGQFACFSFQAVKHISTPDGGMLVLPEVLKEKAGRLHWFGIDREAKFADRWQNEIKEVGYKYQMNDIAAAMGLEGLKALDYQIYKRKHMKGAYIIGLRNVKGIQPLPTDVNDACWLMTVLVERREDFRRKLADQGIESNQVHTRSDRHPIFHASRGQFPNMDAIESKYLVLPLHMGMLVEDVERICDVIRSGW